MNRPAPAEFAEFVREVSIRALDRMADRVKELAKEQRAVVRAWSRLSPDDKHSLLTELLAAALATAPPEENPSKESAAPKPIRRYDPDEVAATLPVKALKRPKKSVRKVDFPEE